MNKKKKKVIFLDRDGVINKLLANNWVKKWDDFFFLKGVKEAFSLLAKNNYTIFIVSNQRVIGLKEMKREELDNIHDLMLQELQNYDPNIEIKKIYICPHLEEDNCLCRKPKAGMFFQAQKEFNINLKKALMVGDKKTDEKAAAIAKIGQFFKISPKQNLYDIVKKIINN